MPYLKLDSIVSSSFELLMQTVPRVIINNYNDTYGTICTVVLLTKGKQILYILLFEIVLILLL